MACIFLVDSPSATGNSLTGTRQASNTTGQFQDSEQVWREHGSKTPLIWSVLGHLGTNLRVQDTWPVLGQHQHALPGHSPRQFTFQRKDSATTYRGFWVDMCPEGDNLALPRWARAPNSRKCTSHVHPAPQRAFLSELKNGHLSRAHKELLPLNNRKRNYAPQTWVKDWNRRVFKEDIHVTNRHEKMLGTISH